MTSVGWLWIYGGVFLMLAELAVPGFVICFFGLSACTVGLLRLLLGDAFGDVWQMAAFSAFSILYIVLLRRLFKKAFVGKRVSSEADLNNESAGRTGRVVEAIVPPHLGRILLGDAEWTASSDDPIAAGADVQVISRNNLTMHVKEL